MQIVELHADGWVTAVDFMNALQRLAHRIGTVTARAPALTPCTEGPLHD